MNFSLLLPLALLTPLLLCDCSKHAAQASVETPSQQEQSVSAVRVGRADLSGTIALTAEFVPYQDVDVMAKVAGYIKAINVDIGDRVHQGQVLAVLEVPEMESEIVRAGAAIEQGNAESTRAEDEVRRMESTHEIAHLSLGRIQTVAQKEPGLVPQQQVDEAKARDLEAEAQIAAAKSALVAAKERIRVVQADLARLKTMQAYETIVAPFDGRVTKRYASKGSMIQAGTASQSQAMPVVRVAQDDPLRLMLPVPESSVPGVSVGRPVSVRVPSLSRIFTGKVTRFTGNVQLSTRTMDTEVDVPNAMHTLMPGMYAEVDLALQEHRNALVVPPDAIDRTGPEPRAFTVGHDNTIHIVTVKPGIETAQQVEILSGIDEGALLVAGRRGSLKEGDRVKPVIAEYLSSR
jgi:RND family efflux transporter MFP subunit